MRLTNKVRILFIAALVATLGLSGHLVIPSNLAVANESKHSSSEVEMAQLLNNLGSHHHSISTRSKLTQRYFDQGLILAYGFNHAEAARSFQTAAKLDSNCAMCYWGLAYVLGPNINAAMEADAVPEAWQALQKALDLSKHATKKEKAYIQALGKRYSSKPVKDRKPLDIAYAKAMQQVQAQYPDDLDAATLFVEALMDTTPWDYWTEDGKSKPEGVEIMATLERVLKQNPNHPGANHLYIHAVEKERPELGIAAADRLMNLVPGAGHLVATEVLAGELAANQGDYEQAIAHLQKAVSLEDALVYTEPADWYHPYGNHWEPCCWPQAVQQRQSKCIEKT